ncbi:hypothetical protein MAR_019979 [Mya arenaria]|uniref:Uncharacterized protein n=1 Tax=Mya arenaria TaxID=6604 RepID=A0ABY7E3Q8_MYAAR|nr:hypothetical protein MAR_019979 [Mya arenaria]
MWLVEQMWKIQQFVLDRLVAQTAGHVEPRTRAVVVRDFPEKSVQKLFTSNVLGRRKIRPAKTQRTFTILYRATLNTVMLWKDVKTIKKYQQ